MITITQAKKIIETELQKRNLEYTKISGRTVSFSGFGFGDRIFIRIYGWKPNKQWDDLRNIAKKNGFSIEAQQSIF